jgi:hypothetical protein
MALLRVGELPGDALAAAAQFHEGILPNIPADGDLVLLFQPADHTHRAWRLAAVQGLARARAPGRVNGLAGADEAAISAARDYLENAPGVTGQYWPLDAEGAWGA